MLKIYMAEYEGGGSNKLISTCCAIIFHCFWNSYSILWSLMVVFSPL